MHLVGVPGGDILPELLLNIFPEVHAVASHGTHKQNAVFLDSGRLQLRDHPRRDGPYGCAPGDVVESNDRAPPAGRDLAQRFRADALAQRLGDLLWRECGRIVAPRLLDVDLPIVREIQPLVPIALPLVSRYHHRFRRALQRRHIGRLVGSHGRGRANQGNHTGAPEKISSTKTGIRHNFSFHRAS